MYKLMKIKSLKNYGVLDCGGNNNLLVIAPTSSGKSFIGEDDVSLVIIDEMQAINHPKWGPLLEDIIEQLLKKDLLTYLLRLLLNRNLKSKKLKKYLKKEHTPSGYWRFIFSKENIDEEINNCLNILKENRLTEEDSNSKLSLTSNGILIAAKRIKVETYLFFKT